MTHFVGCLGLGGEKACARHLSNIIATSRPPLRAFRSDSIRDRDLFRECGRGISRERIFTGAAVDGRGFVRNLTSQLESLRDSMAGVGEEGLTMDAEETELLHKAIKEGDFKQVQDLLCNQAAGQDFSHNGRSALFTAFVGEIPEITSSLIHHGAKIYPHEARKIRKGDTYMADLNHLLLAYNRKSEESCVFRMLLWSESPQGLDGERLDAVREMYECLYACKITKMIMKVLETEPFDIVFDFSSTDIDKVHRSMVRDDSGILGITLPLNKEIFVGAKNLLCDDPFKKNKIYGVVAEEFCHLAMSNLFGNMAKPYRSEDVDLNVEFSGIVEKVNFLMHHCCHLEPSIKDVFTLYERRLWETELIARVPRVLATYGEEMGRSILRESGPLSALLSFYERYVHPKCTEYSIAWLNVKPQRLMNQLMKKNDFISYKEKETKPLMEDFPPFKDFLVDEEGIFVITTNSTKLCTLQVYHELKNEFQLLFQKRCLFFSRKCFEMNKVKILRATRVGDWKYMIIVLDEVDINLKKLKKKYIDHFSKRISKDLNIVLISNSQSLGDKFLEKTLNYKWSNLSKEFKRLRTWPLEYIVNGKRYGCYVKEKEVPIFSEKDLTRIINGDVVEVCNGGDLESQGYDPSTYIERKLQAVTLDKDIFKNLPRDTSIYLSGLSGRDYKKLLIDEEKVQFVKGPNDHIQSEKRVFIVGQRNPLTFNNFKSKSKTKFNIWIHHHDELFYLRRSDSPDDAFKEFRKSTFLSEVEVLKYLKETKILIIADKAGYGKSTLLSSIICGMKKSDDLSWNLRVNFHKFCTDPKKDPLSFGHILENSDKEEILDHFCEMVGKESGLEKLLFRRFSGREGCSVYFDGFDEIPSKYESNALRLLSTLRKGSFNIVVTTRQHHQENLEDLLDAFSYQLVHFSTEDQVMYLDKIWKNDLKNTNFNKNPRKDVPERICNFIRELKKDKDEADLNQLVLKMEAIDLEKSLESIRLEIDELDFSKLALGVLRKTFLDKEMLEFIGIPLHLFMIGVIYLNSNFNMDIQTDLYGLYSNFIDQKIFIYLEEKQLFRLFGYMRKKMVENIKKNTYRIHTHLAKKLIYEGEECLVNELKEKDDYELASALGIVFIVKGKVQFIHRTFAEFFLVEYLKQNVNVVDLRKVLVEIIFEEKYNVTRWFLSSALETQNFEGLPIELFKDLDFLVTLIDKIILKEINATFYHLESETFHILKIVNHLLHIFEKVDIDKQYFDKYINKLHKVIMRWDKRRGGGNEFIDHHILGACLTANMMRCLLRKSFKIYSKAILCFSRYSKKFQDIRDVFGEYMITQSESGQVTVSQNEYNESYCKRLLSLLNIKDSDGDNFVSYAIWNHEVDVYASILKYFRDGLGKESFVKEIIENERYEMEMEDWISLCDPKTLLKSLQSLHSLFKGETKILFNNLLRRKIIGSVIFAETDEFGYSSEEVVKIVRECLGDDDIVSLFMETKFKEKARNGSEKNEKIQNFIESINTKRGNIIHATASKETVLLDNLLSNCNVHLKKEDVIDMLKSTNEEGLNVIHLLVTFNSYEILIKNLMIIHEFIGNDEEFQDILGSTGEHNWNILHYFAFRRDLILDKLLNFCKSYLGKECVKEMIMSADVNGHKVIHLLVLKNSYGILINNLKVIQEFIGNNEQYKNILTSKGIQNWNILQYFAYHRYLSLDKLLNFCESYLGKECVKNMIMSPDVDGDNVIHLLEHQNSNEVQINNLKVIQEFKGKDEQLLDHLGGLIKEIWKFILTLLLIFFCIIAYKLIYF